MPGCCSSWGHKKSDMTERLNWRTFFQINWFDLLAIQGTLKNLLQFKSVSSLVLSLPYDSIPHPYMSTGKTIILTIWTFVGKVMSLLFNTLSRLVIAFLLMSKCPAVTIGSAFGAQENKICLCFHFSPSICHEVMGLKLKCVFVTVKASVLWLLDAKYCLIGKDPDA